MADSEPLPIPQFPAPLARMGSLPSLIIAAGKHAAEKFIEYFTAHIRNRNTREAYARAVGKFLGWCEGQESFARRHPPSSRGRLHRKPTPRSSDREATSRCRSDAL